MDLVAIVVVFAETSLDSSFAPLGGRNLSPLGALFLRHMPLQRRQAFPRLLLVDHRRHPPKSSERESQNLEGISGVLHELNVCVREARGFTWQLGSRTILPRFTSFREEPAFETVLPSTRAPRKRPTSPRRTRLNRAPNSELRTAMPRFTRWLLLALQSRSSHRCERRRRLTRQLEASPGAESRPSSVFFEK